MREDLAAPEWGRLISSVLQDGYILMPEKGFAFQVDHCERVVYVAVAASAAADLHEEEARRGVEEAGYVLRFRPGAVKERPADFLRAFAEIAYRIGDLAVTGI